MKNLHNAVAYTRIFAIKDQVKDHVPWGIREMVRTLMWQTVQTATVSDTVRDQLRDDLEREARR